MVVTIRRYVDSDIDAMLDLVEKFLYQARAGVVNHFAEFDFDRSKVYNILNGRIRDKTFFCNVVVKDNIIVGGLAGSVDELMFSRQLIAKEWLMYFDPSFASVRVALRLVTSYVTWAKSQGAIEVQIATSTGYKQDQFGQLMKLAGFDKFMVGYSKKV